MGIHSSHIFKCVCILFIIHVLIFNIMKAFLCRTCFVPCLKNGCTVNKKGEKSVLIKSTGNEKSRITCMLCCLADGTKLPPYVSCYCVLWRIPIWTISLISERNGRTIWTRYGPFYILYLSIRNGKIANISTFSYFF